MFADSAELIAIVTVSVVIVAIAVIAVVVIAVLIIVFVIFNNSSKGSPDPVLMPTNTKDQEMSIINTNIDKSNPDTKDSV